MDTVAAPAAGAANGTVTLYSGPVPVAKAEDNALARNLMWYHFFGLLWTNQARVSGGRQCQWCVCALVARRV